MLERIGFYILAAVIMAMAGCAQPDQSGGDDIPLRMDDQIWQQQEVDDLQKVDRTPAMHHNTRMAASDTLGRMLKRRERISEAVVVVTDQHAYVGIKPQSKRHMDREIPDSMRARIILAMKTADAKLVHIYVSGHPDIYRTLKSYSSKLKYGVSDRSLVQSFNTRIATYFPYDLGR